jgi:hypothetical protein
MTSHRKLIGIGVTALSLALAVATRPSPRGSAVAVQCTSAAALRTFTHGTSCPSRGSAVIKQSSAPWYRAPMLPIVPSVGRTMTRRPGSMWATMVSGILARDSHHKLET